MNLRRVDPASSPIENSPGRKTQLDNLPSPPPQFLEEKTYLVKTWTMWGGGPKGEERQLLIRQLNSWQNKFSSPFCSFSSSFKQFHNQNRELTVTSLSSLWSVMYLANWDELLGAYQSLIRATMRHYRSARQGKAQHFFAHIRVERTCIKRRPSYFSTKVFSIGRSVHPSVLLMSKLLVRLLSAYQGQSG